MIRALLMTLFIYCILFRSIIFVVLVSTQFILPTYLNLSLLFYKQLDQSWLEDLFRIDPSNQLTHFTLQINLSVSKLPQNTLLSAARSIITVIIITALLYY